jgi:hypothetical protein
VASVVLSIMCEKIEKLSRRCSELAIWPKTFLISRSVRTTIHSHIYVYLKCLTFRRRSGCDYHH